MRRIDEIDALTTEDLVVQILSAWENGERVMFLVTPGYGYKVMQRIRVKVSRIRNKQRREGKKQMHFTIHHTAHPHTEKGLRYEAIVTWRTQTDEHRMIEKFEDLIGHGGQI